MTTVVDAVGFETGEAVRTVGDSTRMLADHWARALHGLRAFWGQRRRAVRGQPLETRTEFVVDDDCDGGLELQGVDSSEEFARRQRVVNDAKSKAIERAWRPSATKSTPVDLGGLVADTRVQAM